MLSSLSFHIAVIAALVFLRFGVLRPYRRSPRLQSARETCDTLGVTLFALFFLIQPFVAQAYVVPSGSMENSLPIGTRFLASPLAPRVAHIRAGDVLVFNPPKVALELAGHAEGEVWVKRCVGTPGQTIEMRRNVLWRDGKVVREPYAIWVSPGLPSITYDLKIVGGAVYSREYDALGRPGLWEQSQVAAPNQDAISRAASGAVPLDRFLMLGDHRNDSLDGHVWGFVSRGRIVGRAFAAFWPPQQIGTIAR